MDSFYFPTQEDENMETSSYTESYDDDLDSSLDDFLNDNNSYNESYDESYNESSDLDDLLSDYMQEGSGEIPERPSARPYDEKSIPSARSSEIDQSVYNKQIENLKRSFKESVDIIESMKAMY